MRKKIGLIGLVFILIFGLAGCGKSETTEYNQSEMEYYADIILTGFSQMTEEGFDYYRGMSDLELDLQMIDLQLPISGENFLSMLDAWDFGRKECGVFIKNDRYTMDVTNDGAVLTTEATFEEKNGTIEFAFDEKMNMESITISAEYSIGEILEKAVLNTFLGMGTVFVVLIFISFIISLFRYIPTLEKKFRKNKQDQPEKAEIVPDTGKNISIMEEADESELAAVIAAAVAAAEGVSADSFIVRSIKRRNSNKWN